MQTAIAEGLAHAIVQRRNPDGSPLPEFLHSKRILQLDVGQLMAGTQRPLFVGCLQYSLGIGILAVLANRCQMVRPPIPDRACSSFCSREASGGLEHGVEN
eukprot:1161030-Pelagomonas_calceolata.AAC.1